MKHLRNPSPSSAARTPFARRRPRRAGSAPQAFGMQAALLLVTLAGLAAAALAQSAVAAGGAPQAAKKPLDLIAFEGAGRIRIWDEVRSAPKSATVAPPAVPNDAVPVRNGKSPRAPQPSPLTNCPPPPRLGAAGLLLPGCGRVSDKLQRARARQDPDQRPVRRRDHGGAHDDRQDRARAIQFLARQPNGVRHPLRERGAGVVLERKHAVPGRRGDVQRARQLGA